MNKAEKIKAEIERLKKSLPWGSCASQLSMECNCKNEAYNEVLSYIDSLEEEPVSEDLEYASEKYACRFSSSKYGHDKVKDAFITGAQWQKEHLEMNRIKYCNNITEDQYNLESDFIDDFIDKHDRMPTFLDAIEYGMKLQKEQDQSTIELAEDHAMLAGMEKMKDELMKNVVLETKVMKDSDGDGIDTPYEEWLTLEDTEIPFIPDDIGLKDGDKVKLIIIREE